MIKVNAKACQLFMYVICYKRKILIIPVVIQYCQYWLLRQIVQVHPKLYSRVHTVLKSPWILGEVLEFYFSFKSPWILGEVLEFYFSFKSPWILGEVLEFYFSFKSPWIFFKFECSGLDSVFWCFLVVQDRIIIAQRI